MSHPEIGSLVRAKDQMIDNLKKENYVMALRDMRAISIDIKKDDMDQSLFTKIMKEETQASSTESMKQYRRHLKSSAKTYWDWAHELIQILWDKGYLADKKYTALLQDEVKFE